MIATIQEHMRELDKLVEGSTSGDMKIPENSIVHSEDTSLFSQISGEYTRLVQKYSEYDFSIVRDPQRSEIRIYWNRKADPK